MKYIQNIPRIYQIRAIDEINRIFGEFAKKYNVQEKEPGEQTIRIYDTFDWRLYHSNLTLIHSGNTLILRELYRRTPIISEELLKYAKTIHFSPGSLLFKEIEPIIKTRTLIQHAAAKVHTRKFHLFTETRNPELRIEVKEIIPVKAETTLLSNNIFIIIDNPGQAENYFKSIITKNSVFKNKRIRRDLFFHILALYNIKPGNYSGKISIKLLSHMTTETACRIILGTLLYIMTRNEEGIKNDIDTEFLHDFRVAIRRTRSLLSQVRKVFPKDLLQPFRGRFKYYAKLTNDPRDIDVYMLKIEDFKKLLPGDIKDGLIPLYNHLKEKHTILYKKLLKELESKEYNTLIKNWRQFLNTPLKPDEKPLKAETSILKTAKRVIRKQRRIVIETGLLIREDSPPDTFHSLRIECKKLRYLLEFFLSLFPKKIMKTIISRMKTLQDNLGIYHDLQVQQEMLSRFLEHEKMRAPVQEETEKAIRFLKDFFKQEEERVRKKFYSIFEQFYGAEVWSSFLLL